VSPDSSPRDGRIAQEEAPSFGRDGTAEIPLNPPFAKGDLSFGVEVMLTCRAVCRLAESNFTPVQS
jgi:hypothetical protein